MKQFFRNFLLCGIVGWSIEIFFSSLQSLQRRQYKLIGNTSMWMFPIYGLGSLIGPLSRPLRKQKIWQRGLIYMILIYSVEFLSGKFLQKKGLCPWDYSISRFHIHRIIRLDYAPCWFAIGLLFEKITRKSNY